MSRPRSFSWVLWFNGEEIYTNQVLSKTDPIDVQQITLDSTTSYFISALLAKSHSARFLAPLLLQNCPDGTSDPPQIMSYVLSAWNIWMQSDLLVLLGIRCWVIAWCGTPLQWCGHNANVANTHQIPGGIVDLKSIIYHQGSDQRRLFSVMNDCIISMCSSKSTSMARRYKRYDILTIRWQKPLLILFYLSLTSHVSHSEDIQGIRNHWCVLPLQLGI